MAGAPERVYFADSKAIARAKLGLHGKQYSEEFSKFENICIRVYEFRIGFDPKVKWKDLDESTLAKAEALIKAECGSQKLTLENSALDELIPWRLHKSHDSAQKKKHNKNGMYRSAIEERER